MERIRVLIVDDEIPARIRLRQMLEQEPDIAVVGECGDGGEAVAFIRQHAPQIVFLDIQMKRVNGFDVVEAIGNGPFPAIVFTTAYDQYAVRAFETNALDYLLKPFGEERLQIALRRCRERIFNDQIQAYTDRLLSLLQSRQIAPMNNPPLPDSGYQGRLVLKTGNRLVFLDVDQINWIEAEGVYVRVHTTGKSHVLRESMNNLEQRLDPARFVRTHRSVLVNITRVKEVIPNMNGGGTVVLTDGSRVKMSRSYRDRIKASFG
jgi:two-component system LytT family response regulator